MGSPGRASQQPRGRRLFGLSTPCGRAGTSSWPPCTRRRSGQTALRSMLSPPPAAETQYSAWALARVDHVRVLAADAAISRKSPARRRQAATAPRCPGCGRNWAPDPQARPGALPARISRPRTSPARTSPAHPGHRMQAFLRAGNERRVRLPPHRRAGRSRRTVRAYLGDAWSLLDHAATTTVR